MEAIQEKVSFRILLLLAVVTVSGTATLAQNFPECTISPAGPLTVTVGSSVSFTVIATDPDPGAIVTLESSGVPSGATMLPSLHTFGASGLSSTFTWKPTAAQIGSFEIDFFVLDNEFNLSFCSITIDVVPSANQPPVAADDAYSVDEDNTLSVPAPGVLSNDSDPEDDPLSAVMGTGPLNGLLSLNSDGSFTYTPSSNFNGTDTFTYQASDGSSSSAAATVTITVNPVEEPFDFCSSLSPIVTDVMDLADDSSIPKKVRKHIKGAAKHLEKALEHCGDERLEKTFHQIDHAIFELERAIHRSENSDLDTQLVGIIDELVGLIVAKTEEVVAAAVAADPDNKHTKKAQKHLEKGLKHLTAGRLHRAIDEFIKAVHHALKVVGDDDGLLADGSNEVLGSPETLTPLSYKLDQNYPNPFNPSTVISYELADESIVWLKVYDVLGRLVASLVDEVQSAGRHEVELDGSYLPSGVYFYRLQVQTDSAVNYFVETKKMVLAK